MIIWGKSQRGKKITQQERKEKIGRGDVSQPVSFFIFFFFSSNVQVGLTRRIDRELTHLDPNRRFAWRWDRILYSVHRTRLSSTRWTTTYGELCRDLVSVSLDSVRVRRGIFHIPLSEYATEYTEYGTESDTDESPRRRCGSEMDSGSRSHGAPSERLISGDNEQMVVTYYDEYLRSVHILGLHDPCWGMS